MSLYRRQSHLVYKTKQNKLFTLLSLPRLGRRSCLIPHSCDQGMTPRSGHISAIKGTHRGHRIVVFYPLSRLKQHAESISLVSGCVCVISLGRASFGRHGQEYKYYSADPQFLPIFTIILTEKNHGDNENRRSTRVVEKHCVLHCNSRTRTLCYSLCLPVEVHPTPNIIHGFLVPPDCALWVRQHIVILISQLSMANHPINS